MALNTPRKARTKPNANLAAAEAQPEPATDDFAQTTMADGSTAGLRLPDVLFNLHHVDFRRQPDLKRLKSTANTPFFAPLFSSLDQYDSSATYTVQNYWNTWLYLLCRTRNEPSLISNYFDDKEWKPLPDVIELDTSAQDDNPDFISSLSPCPEFPRYILDLGEVFVQKRCPNSHQNIQRSSGFHLVMDVTKPQKPLWIVYRYHEIGQHDRLDSTPIYKQDLVWHPFASAAGIEFDSAQVFATVAEWRGDSTPPASFEAAVDLVKRTGKIRKPTFVEPVLREVKQEIQKGWSRPQGKKH